jgi:hypothetical protein
MIPSLPCLFGSNQLVRNWIAVFRGNAPVRQLQCNGYAMRNGSFVYVGFFPEVAIDVCGQDYGHDNRPLRRLLER